MCPVVWHATTRRGRPAEGGSEVRSFRNLSIASKLLILTVAGIVAIGVTAYTGYSGLRNVDLLIRRVLNVNVPTTTTAMDLKASLYAVDAAVAKIVASTDRGEQDALNQNIKELSSLIEVQLSLLAQADVRDDQLHALTKEAKAKWEEAKGVIETQLIPAVYAGRVGEIKDLAVQVQQDQFQMLTSLADGVVKRLEDVNAAAKAAIERTVWRSVEVILVFLALGILVGAFIVILSQVMIARPVRKVVDALRDIAEGEGDLTRRLEVRSHDEVGQVARWFNVFVDKIAEVIRRIGETAQSLSAHSEELAATTEEVTGAVNEVARTIQGVAQGAQQQVQSMNEAVQTIRQMAKGIQEVAQIANQVAMASQEATQLSGHGGEAVLQVKKVMHTIHQTVGNSAGVIKGLEQRSKNIGEIVSVITGIADQTNLLALNAAIEAARAGEHGRGFAVVADEVRKLAENSARSAKEIERLLEEIREETQRAVEAMAQGTKEVEQGVSVVEETGSAFERISKAVVQISGQTQGVSAASEQLASGTRHISKAVEEVVATSEQNAASAQQVSAATEEVTASIAQIAQSANSLASLAQELQGLVRRFRV